MQGELSVELGGSLYGLLMGIRLALGPPGALGRVIGGQIGSFWAKAEVSSDLPRVSMAHQGASHLKMYIHKHLCYLGPFNH